MSEGLSGLGSTLTSTLLAFSVLIVTALLLGLALAATLVAIGLPWWAAFWVVTLAAAALGYYLVRRASRHAHTTGEAAANAAARAKDDVAWIAGNSTLDQPTIRSGVPPWRRSLVPTKRCSTFSHGRCSRGGRRIEIAPRTTGSALLAVAGDVGGVAAVDGDPGDRRRADAGRHVRSAGVVDGAPWLSSRSRVAAHLLRDDAAARRDHVADAFRRSSGQLLHIIENSPKERTHLITWLSQYDWATPAVKAINAVPIDDVVASAGKRLLSYSSDILGIVGYGVTTIFLAMYVLAEPKRSNGVLFRGRAAPASHEARAYPDRARVDRRRLHARAVDHVGLDLGVHVHDADGVSRRRRARDLDLRGPDRRHPVRGRHSGERAGQVFAASSAPAACRWSIVAALCFSLSRI